MNNISPLVSICIPVYNGAAFIRRVLESCTYQTYRNIEVVVVDNASTDGTADVVLKYARRDPRIKYFRNEETIRIMPNFFRSFSYATGEFIQHVGHDDWLSRDYIEAGVRLFQENPEAGAIMHRTIALNFKDGKLYFNIDNTFADGRYSRDYLLKSVFRTVLGGLMIYSMMRRKDILATESLIQETYTHPVYGKLYKDAQATDWLVLLGFIAKYPYFVFTNQGAFMKIDHPKNEGKFFGLESNSPSGILRWFDMVQNCVYYVFRRDFKSYLSGARIRLGSEALGSVLTAAVKRRFAASYIKELHWRDIASFLKDYSFFQKLIVSLIFIPTAASRGLRFYFKKVKGQTRFDGGSKYFLENKGAFYLFGI